jgi:Domain of unknown function (DUF4440)
MKRCLCFLLPLLVASAAEPGRQAKSGPLFEAITRMDRHLFNAFNAHNVDRLMSLASKNVELYQENDGLKNYEECITEFKDMFAHDSDIRRELVEGTVEVYPIGGYGALEVGQHRFCHTQNGKEDCGVFGFAVLWQKTDDSWKVSRLVNYRR